MKSRTILIALTLTIVVGGSATAGSFITGAQIKNGSVTGLDVRNHSLTSADFHGSVRGPRGFVGQTGDPGPAGIIATDVYDSAPIPQCANNGGGCQVAGTQVSCPAGLFLISGGYIIDHSIDETVTYAAADSATVYGVVAINRDTQQGTTLTARILCGQAGSRRRAHTTSSWHSGFAVALQQARRELQTPAERRHTGHAP